MAQTSGGVRNIKVFRYDPQQGGEGHFDSYVLNIQDETTTTILDVLLRIQREQDPTLSFRFACRVNMCGSCGMVINGKEGLACKTNVSHIPQGKEVTIRPLNHFPVIKDLVVDMEPFFKKYEEALPFYEPREETTEPAVIRPGSRERQDIGMATDCIACGCCVSSCTMCHYHEGYAGPAALNRAFTLLADSRDGLFEERLDRVLASCYNCRTEFNCTEVCPKRISGTRAIKYIQRLALKHIKAKPETIEAEQPAVAQPSCASEMAGSMAGNMAGNMDRRTFISQVGVGLLGTCLALGVGGVVGAAFVGPTRARTPRLWVPAASLSSIPVGDVTTIKINYETKNGLYTQQVAERVLVSRTGDEIICFKASCTHLGCMVKWDGNAGRFRCACHGGAFDRNGKVIAGPPPKPLDRYPFRVDSDHLLVEVG
ncbi:MAG: succinate dehydrogenase iron-sulfur subunit [Nitrospirae bacterium]|nr:succinate dehydrogenase iron-sulfur subunit [Nitrospirota bacterium]